MKFKHIAHLNRTVWSSAEWCGTCSLFKHRVSEPPTQAETGLLSDFLSREALGGQHAEGHTGMEDPMASPLLTMQICSPSPCGRAHEAHDYSVQVFPWTGWSSASCGSTFVQPVNQGLVGVQDWPETSSLSSSLCCLRQAHKPHSPFACPLSEWPTSPGHWKGTRLTYLDSPC